MKVAVILQSIFPPKVGASGADRRVRDIARGIAAQPGVSVDVLVPRRSDDPEKQPYDGLQVYHLGRPRSAGQGQLAWRTAFWREVQDYCLRTSVDAVLLYGVTIDALLPARRLRRRGIAVAAEFCDLRSSGVVVSGAALVLRWAAYKADEMLLPQVTDLNVVISRYIEGQVLRLAPRTPAIRVPVLVDPELFRLVPDSAGLAQQRWQIAPDSFLFGYVGGLWSNEGVKYLVQGFEQVAKSHPKAHLIIAGRLQSGPEYDDVSGMIREFGLSDRVTTPGWVDTDDVRTIYTRCQALILPQLNDKFSTAALPTKLAEYACMGRPIVATTVGDVPSYFEDGRSALLVPSRDAEALASAMSRLIEIEGLCSSLGSAARMVAKTHFDYRRAGRNIVEGLRNAMSQA